MGAAILGGLISAGGSAASAYANYKSEEAARNSQESGAQAASNSIANSTSSVLKSYNDVNSMLNNYYNTMTGTGSLYDSSSVSDANTAYQKLLSGEGTTYTPTDFSYDKTLENFYDKAWQTNNQAQMRSLEGSAANAGNLYSSGLLNNLASTTSANATNAYKDARTAYLADKGLAEQTWAQENSNSQAAANNALSRETNYGNYLGNYGDFLGNYQSSMANNTLAKSSAYQTAMQNYAAQLANAGGSSTTAMPKLY